MSVEGRMLLQKFFLEYQSSRSDKQPSDTRQFLSSRKKSSQSSFKSPFGEVDLSSCICERTKTQSLMSSAYRTTLHTAADDTRLHTQSQNRCQLRPHSSGGAHRVPGGPKKALQRVRSALLHAKEQKEQRDMDIDTALTLRRQRSEIRHTLLRSRDRNLFGL